KSPVPPATPGFHIKPEKRARYINGLLVRKKANQRAGFRLADARRRTGLARCTGIALHPFQLRIISPIDKQN
ncbi:MAG: hypothetical protein KAI41_08315, partial [Hyphomicrobiaceae bacterium]|nr:hypothetical protein [Hyphomicrobiaceae bacterium]